MTYAVIDRRTWKVVAKAPRRNQLPKPYKGLVVNTDHLERLSEQDITALYQHVAKQEGVPPWVIDAVKEAIEKANGRRGKSPSQQGTDTTPSDDTDEGPVAKVRRIAQAMAGASRSDIIAACVEAGVNVHTARTQYQRWHATHKAAND